MTKLESAFKSLESTHPGWSTITCLAVAVMGKNYGKMAIGQAFRKLVEKDDYSKSQKEAILNNLKNL